MSVYVQLSAYALLIACTVLTLVWWRQVYTKNAGVVDGWWSYNFGLIALFLAISGEGHPAKKIIMSVMVCAWAFRLGTHLLIRNTKHPEEDSRYKKLRQEYGQQENLRMWVFFMYQAISNVLLSLPFLLIAQDQSGSLSFLFYAGIVLWTVAIIGESIADQQLKNFKKDSSNKGKVCQTGLWNYSRHPNYFFEWLIWVAFALSAYNSPYGFWAILCPVIMYFLLNNVTGIPMLEDLAVKSKGQEYIHYQQTTSAFFPWFKRKN